MPAIPYEDALARQQNAAAVVRAIACGAAVLSVINVSSWLIEGVLDADLWQMRFYADHLARAGALLGVAVVGWIWPRRIARALLGAPASDRCPGCDYTVAEDAAQCPECGLSFAHEPGGRHAGSMEEWLLRRRHTVRTVIRVGSVGILLYGLWNWLGVMSWIITVAFAEMSPGSIEGEFLVGAAYAASLTLAVTAAVAVALRLGERRLVAWLAPVAASDRMMRAADVRSLGAGSAPPGTTQGRGAS